MRTLVACVVLYACLVAPAPAVARPPAATATDPDDSETVLSTVTFEPFGGASLISWVQPLPDPADGEIEALFVKGEQGSEPVQLDRLAGDLLLCTARIGNGATGRATIVRGASAAEAQPLPAPDLSALRLVLHGQDGARYVAHLTSDPSPKVIYDGPLRRTTRYTTHFLKKQPGGFDAADVVLGVQAYVTWCAGTERVELDLRIHNGAQRADLSGDCGTVYFTDLVLRTGGRSVRQGEASIAQGKNVFPPRAQLVRRYVLGPSGDEPEGGGADLRTAWASAGASYFTLARFGPDRTLVPRVPLTDVRHDVKDLAGQAAGPFRLIDIPNPDAPGGTWIFPFPGGRRGLDPRADSLDELARIADRIQERMPIAFFDAQTGEPLTSRALALAGDGKQPFQYDLQARHRIRRFDLPGEPWLPSGMLTGDMGLGRDDERSIHEGSCPYEDELERWRPYDGQHLIRGFTHAAALWFWTGDALSADWIRMVAADAGYDYTLEDVGGVEPPYRLRSLKTQLAAVESAPGQGAYCEREWAWTSVVTALACRIERTEELAARCSGLLRFATRSAMPTGIPWRIYAPGSGGNVVYWNNYGTPQDVDACGTFQVPMIAFALSCLAEMEESPELVQAARSQIVRMAESVLDAERFTPSQYHADEVGPPMSTWVARKNGEPFETARGSGRSNPTNFPLLYALAFRATGSTDWLRRIEDLGRPGPKDPLRMALWNTGFSEAFAALALAEHR